MKKMSDAAMRHALVVDDDEDVRNFISAALAEEGFRVSEATTLGQALLLLETEEWSLAVLDKYLPDGDGHGLLERVRDHSAEAHINLVTGQARAMDALDALAAGAHSYLVKPFTATDVRDIARSAYARATATAEGETIEGRRNASSVEPCLIGRSRAIIEVVQEISRIAPTKLPTVITGETGTGKEVFARLIHKYSPRAPGPFLAINCGALPAELIESELFGHARGSFTGAHQERVGLLESAEGGTVFLDEITETSRDLQVKLLRFLQRGEVRRIGSNSTMVVDVRVVAASNRKLEAEVEAGRFREDLYYRLGGSVIELPPLRSRGLDIPLLVEHFAARAGRKVRCSELVLKVFDKYPWPGNVRELENAVARAAEVCHGEVKVSDLPPKIRRWALSEMSLDDSQEDCQSVPELITLAEVERRHVERVFAFTGGKVQEAARILGISRKTLSTSLKRWRESGLQSSTVNSLREDAHAPH